MLQVKERKSVLRDLPFKSISIFSVRVIEIWGLTEEHWNCVPFWLLKTRLLFGDFWFFCLPESHTEDQQVSRGASSQLKSSEWNLLIRGMWQRQKQIQKWPKRSLVLQSKRDTILVLQGKARFLWLELKMGFFSIWSYIFPKSGASKFDEIYHWIFITHACEAEPMISWGRKGGQSVQICLWIHFFEVKYFFGK